MKTLSALALLALLWAPGASAQAEPTIPKARYPALPASAAALEGFAPPGWRIEARAEGDLDGDGAADAAFVLRGTDPALVVKTDGLGPPELDTNPRILAVALRRGEAFTLAAQNRTLIPRHENPSMEDPFEDSEIEIRRGTLRVAMRLFMTAGGWTTFRSTFTFRLDKPRTLTLIGFDKASVERNTLASRTISANFLTGRARVETEANAEAKPVVRWRTLSRGPVPIERVGNGLDFEVGVGR